MKRLIVQGLGMIAGFLFIWFALSEVNWMKIFNIEQMTEYSEEKLGELFWDWFHDPNNEISSAEIYNSIDSVLSRICGSNSIDRNLVKLHIVSNEEINAFALPDKHLVIYSGLIKSAKNEQELAGIVSHELAHMELNHVMKKLVKEAGLSVLISISTGNSGGDLVKETAKFLSSTAYDRKLESEADAKAVTYLIKARINPKYFADFLSRLSDNNNANLEYTWISTHPDSNKRAFTILESTKTDTISEIPILTSEQWKLLKEKIENYQ